MIDDDALETLQRLIPMMARRSVQVPTFRFGVVTGDNELDEVEVLVDGDSEISLAFNATGSLLPDGARVVVVFYPPHGILVNGVLDTPQPRGFMGSFGNDTAEVVLSASEWDANPVTFAMARKFHTGRLYRAFLNAVWWSSAFDTTIKLEFRFRRAQDSGFSGPALGRTFYSAFVQSHETVGGHIDFEVPANGYYDFQVQIARVVGPGEIRMAVNSLSVSIDDVGVPARRSV